MKAVDIKQKLNTDDRWLYRAVMAIYKQQTPDEQRAEITVHENGKGFNAFDAPFLSSIALQLINGHMLTHKQTTVTRTMMRKYCKQLEAISERRI